MRGRRGACWLLLCLGFSAVCPVCCPSGSKAKGGGAGKGSEPGVGGRGSLSRIAVGAINAQGIGIM